MCGFPHKKSPPVTAGRRFFYPCRRSEKDLQPFRPVIHYAQNCILRSLRRFGRQGKCGCKAPRVGHCEAAGRRISQNTRRLQAFLPEPEVAWLNEEISSGRFCCTCPPVSAGRFFHSGGNHMKKRLLSLLLVLAMVFSLMPAALAADKPSFQSFFESVPARSMQQRHRGRLGFQMQTS